MKLFISLLTLSLVSFTYSASSIISLEKNVNEAPKLLQELIAQKKPLLLKFYSKECFPCKLLKPIFEKCADLSVNNGKSKLHTKVNFVEVETSIFSSIADDYDIRKNPTLIFLVNGKEVERIVGVTSLKVITAKIEQHFNIKL